MKFPLFFFRNKAVQRSLLGVFAVGIMLSGWFLFRSQAKEQNDLLITPKRGTFRLAITATGELKAKKFVAIQGPTDGMSVGIYQMKISSLVPEGTVIKEGETVAQLDKSVLDEKIKAAELALQKANAQYTQTRLDTTLSLATAREELNNQRFALEEKRLAKEQAVYEAPSIKRQTEIDYEKAERAQKQGLINYQTKVQQAIAKMQSSYTDVEKEQQKLDALYGLQKRFVITSPAAGMVIYTKEWNGKKVTSGSTISPWNPTVATLPDLSVMESLAYINEIDVQKIRVGQPVQIHLDADPTKKLSGTVATIANVGEQRPNSNAKVFEIVVSVLQRDTTLRPGMTTANEIIASTLDNVLFIPLDALHSESGKQFVYKKTRTGIVKQEVRTSAMNDNEVVVEEGLTTDDAIYLSLPPGSGNIPMQYLQTASANKSTDKQKN
ncbi:MAG: HlyD family efflux transporter periplasmic adaptor subunit [Candidatus Kapabacteria bacterium]|jgi:biotin carboxyl carrier protein|nr:HlyD family efflux transporter periplasmic adaptor subunit [Candidatus Kapabacteria bacterium]